MTSGVLFSSGFLLSAFAPNLETCVFSIGIIAGNSIEIKRSSFIALIEVYFCIY